MHVVFFLLWLEKAPIVMSGAQFASQLIDSGLQVVKKFADGWVVVEYKSNELASLGSVAKPVPEVLSCSEHMALWRVPCEMKTE